VILCYAGIISNIKGLYIMSEHLPFDQNPELASMKENLADRAFNLKIKGMMITGALLLAGFALMLFAGPALGMFAPLAGLAVAAAGGIAGLVTMKESHKLEMDRKYLDSYMQGKNHWGKGYREEILEQGWGQRIVTDGPEMGNIPAAPSQGLYRGQ
jgi:hypothetical protein